MTGRNEYGVPDSELVAARAAARAHIEKQRLAVEVLRAQTEDQAPTRADFIATARELTRNRFAAPGERKNWTPTQVKDAYRAHCRGMLTDEAYAAYCRGTEGARS